ncbi:hypothetical protein QBC47DRAFT_375240 [Echria macrotheca]|uniref:SRPBCC family protein n=1 Tax=Echria macrotheca TaxID=438768 RepID=A0AAJ0BJZ9_9PEZI|nr:hypothetical protein QBC47DRAFT_375240 [Echria macrotheca]
MEGETFVSKKTTYSSNPIATPTYGVDGALLGTWSLDCAERFAAPPAVCLEVIRDAGSYGKWNAFCRRMSISKQPDPIPPTLGGFDGSGGEDDQVLLHLGTEFSMDAYINFEDPAGSPRPTALVVSVLEPIREGEGEGERIVGWRIAWRTRPTMFLPSFMLHSERVQEFVDDGRGGTRYTCWETFHGVLAQTTRVVVGKKLLRAIDRWTADLGERALHLHSGGRS